MAKVCEAFVDCVAIRPNDVSNAYRISYQRVRGAYPAGVIVAGGPPQDAGLRIERGVLREFGRHFLASIVSRYGEERRSPAISFNGVLKAVMARVRFHRVFPIMDVQGANDGALFAFKGYDGRITARWLDRRFVLVVSGRNVRVVLSGYAIMIRSDLRVRSTITQINGAQFRIHECFSATFVLGSNSGEVRSVVVCQRVLWVMFIPAHKDAIDDA